MVNMENMGKAKIANLEKSQNKDRGDSVKIGTLSTPMPNPNLGNRCIGAGRDD